MGKWSQYDTDAERLPDGMSRVGYDADTQTYTYRDRTGRKYEGAPGVRYGTMWPVRSSTTYRPAANNKNQAGKGTDLSADVQEFLKGADGRQSEQKRPRTRYKPRHGVSHTGGMS